MTRRLLGVLGALVLLATAAACTDNKDSASADASGSIQVTSTNTECKVSKTSVPSGNLRFAVANKGSKVTEFYLLAADGLRIVGEVENIGPQSTRELVVTAAPGTYMTACKPGMVGDGIRNGFKVTNSGKDLAATGKEATLLKTATTQYEAYVKDQTEQLSNATTEFADLYKAGKDDEARALYPNARVHWERIEPVAESFGTLDPRLDLREADLEAGQAWTGWHAIEKDLWPPKSGYTALTPAKRQALADQLVTDTNELRAKVEAGSFSVRADQISNGAKGLLDEVASGKVTGEEEAWSHTDLWDFQGNVDGARIAYEDLRPVLAQKDSALDKTLQTRFEALQKLLDQYKQGDGFVLYNALTKEQVKQLSDSVNALSEPLSKLTAAVVA